ncbi:endonuclease [Bacteroidia bacterium]|nr:endonuclease [Bacteroidia bacterium]
MKEHYQPYYRKRKTDRRRRRVKGLLVALDVAMMTLSVAVALLLLLGYLAPWVNPNRTVVFAFLGLAVPVLFVANIAVALYWVLRWKAAVIIPAVALLLGVGKLGLIFQPSLGKHYQDNRERGSITVVSHNVHGFINDDGTRIFLDSTMSLIASLTPDIVCLQEYQITHLITRQQAGQLLGSLPFHSVHYKIKGDDDTGFGLAVFSRYPILRSDCMDFEQHSGFVMWADVVCRRDTLRVFNCHFQTTSIDASDKEFVTTTEFMQQDTDENTRRLRTIASKLGENFRLRAVQADTIARVIRSSPYDVVVCGDFNDTPISYTYRSIRGPLADSFVDKGSGHTNTYKGFFNLFRIDYIFHSDTYRTLYYAEPHTDFSDHNPVVATIKKAPL